MSSAETGTQVGPASYSTGGFTITTGLSTVDFGQVGIKTIGALSPYRAVFTRSGAGFTVKVMRRQYLKPAATTGAVSGLPAGVTAAATSAQVYDAESAHVHDINHDHGATTSAGPAGGSGGVFTTLGSGNQSTHTHSFDVPALGSTNSGTTTHDHQWNNIYEHQHSVTNTATDMTLAEVSAGTDLSGTTFYYYAADI